MRRDSEKSGGIIFTYQCIEIEDYLLPRNPVAARKLLAEISSSINLLTLFPEIGSKTNLLSGARYHVVRGHRIYYRAENASETIFVLRVYDCRRDPKEIV